VEVLFSPTAADQRTPGFSGAKPGQGTARGHACSCFAGFWPDQLALLHHQGWRSVAGDSGIAPSRLSRRLLDLLGRFALPDHRCKIETDNTMDTTLQGVGTPKLAAADKMHTNFGVIRWQDGDHRLISTGVGGGHANGLKA